MPPIGARWSSAVIASPHQPHSTLRRPNSAKISHLSAERDDLPLHRRHARLEIGQRLGLAPTLGPRGRVERGFGGWGGPGLPAAVVGAIAHAHRRFLLAPERRRLLYAAFEIAAARAFENPCLRKPS